MAAAGAGPGSASPFSVTVTDVDGNVASARSDCQCTAVSAL